MVQYNQWGLHVDLVEDEELKEIAIQINRILSSQKKMKKLQADKLYLKQHESEAERLIQKLACISLRKGHTEELDVLKNYAYSIIKL